MTNKPVKPGEGEPVVDALHQAHELKARERKEFLEERLGTSGRQSLKWAEENLKKGYMGGKLDSLVRRFKAGLIHPKAFDFIIKNIARKAEERDNKKNIDIVDILINKGKSTQGLENFGANIEEVYNALHHKDEDIRDEAETFLRYFGTRKGTTEKAFLKKVANLKKLGIDHTDVTKSVEGAMAMAGINTPDSSEGVLQEIVGAEGVNTLLEPPNPENEQAIKEAMHRTTEAFQNATRASEELTGFLGELKAPAESLKTKLNDPQYVERVLKMVTEDYDLLSNTIARVDDEASKAALGDFEKAWTAFSNQVKPFSATESDSMYGLFLQQKEGQESRRVLLQTIQAKVGPFMETAFSLDMEGSLQTLQREGLEENREISNQDVETSLTNVVEKYEILLPEKKSELYLKLSKKINENKQIDAALDQAVAGQETEGLYFRNHGAETVARLVDVGQTSRITGLPLFKIGEDGLIYPNEGVNIKYLEPDLNKSVDAETEERLDANGRAIPIPKDAEIVSVQYVKPDEEDIAIIRGTQKWKPIIPIKGSMVVTLRHKQADVVDQSGKKEFLGWARSENAHVEIGSKAELIELIKEQTGADATIEQGEIFLIESKIPKEYTYENMKITNVDELNKKITLAEPITYLRGEEANIASQIKNTRNRKSLSYGEFLSYLMRRQGQVFSMGVVPSAAAGAGAAAAATAAETTEAEASNVVDLNTKGLTPKETKYVASRPRTNKGRFKVFENLERIAKQAAMGRQMSSDEKFDGVEGPASDDMQAAFRQAQQSQQDDQGQPQPRQKPRPRPDDDDTNPTPQQQGFVKEEALDYDKTGMIGQTYIPEQNYLIGLWQRTRVLASDDFMGLFKSMYEYYERRWQRRSKEKYSMVGEGLPYWGTEMGRIKQQAENEEVNQNMEAMENWGEWQVQDTLRKTSNKDQAKACFQVLSKKGVIRWDDVEMWEMLNRFVPQGVRVPIPPGHDPNVQDKETGLMGFDYLKEAIDYMWGEGTYNDWYSENNNVYNQKLKHYYEQGKQTEGDTKHNGSIEGELSILLRKHKEGEYVEAQQYEGLLHFLIEAGKGSSDGKLYFMIEGVAARNPKTGETLLSLDRLGSINGEFSNQLPMMDYLTHRFVPRKGPDGNIVHVPWTMADYESWVKTWDAAEDPKKPCMPNDAVRHHLWNYVLTDEKTIIRNNKGLRSADQMDHDDAHIIIPLADEDLIEDITMSAGGRKRFFTKEGYANAYPGYNQFTKTLADRGESTKLTNTIKGFIRFDGIMSKRYAKGNNDYARLNKAFWDRPSVVDSRFTGWHRAQMQNVIKKIAYAYGDSELIDMVETLHIETESTQDSAQAEKQKEVQQALENFGEKFEEVTKIDKGQTMLNVVQSADLSGMGEVKTQEEMAAEKSRREEMMGADSDSDSTFNDYATDLN